jgi:flagellar assembly protein FliH
VNLETNVDTKIVQPLSFRSIEDHAEIPEPTERIVQEKDDEVPSFDIEAERHAAREQGRLEAENEMHVSVQRDRDALNLVVSQFEQEKRRYFSEVEGEVVKLSLAIAERVLHREAEMDPVLLAGAARVALDQVADASDAVLHVAVSDVDRWNETLKPFPKGFSIEPDEAVPRGEAVLKTRSGTVHLGVRAQLQEIEHGFFELLGRRPSGAV